MSKSASDPLPCPVDQGFTLIELLVVMAVMALVAVLVVPQLMRRGPNLGSAVTSEIIASLEAARLAALQSGQVREPQIAAVAKGATWQPSFPAQTAGPSFEPDGQANGGDLLLPDGNRIHISWIDGHARAAR